MPRKVEAIKRGYANIIGVDIVDMNYNYRRSPGRMVHTLKYITRATFRDYEWDIEMALELRNFRNMVVWGRGLWGGEPAWSLADLGGKARAEVDGLDIEAINSLRAGVCPVCSKPLVWGEALPIGLLNMVEKQPLGAGYYRLADVRPLPVADKFNPQYPLLGYLLNIKHYKLEVAAKRAEVAGVAEAEYQAVLWRDLLLD